MRGTRSKAEALGQYVESRVGEPPAALKAGLADSKYRAIPRVREENGGERRRAASSTAAESDSRKEAGRAAETRKEKQSKASTKAEAIFRFVSRDAYASGGLPSATGPAGSATASGKWLPLPVASRRRRRGGFLRNEEKKPTLVRAVRVSPAAFVQPVLPSNTAMLHQQHLAVRALRPLLRCFFATRAQLQRPLPHSKAAIQQRKPQLTTTWGSHNGLTQPHIGAKYLRHAERIAWELGVVEDIRQFDEAAAAYPNPPKLIAATCV